MKDAKGYVIMRLKAKYRAFADDDRIKARPTRSKR